MTQHECNIICKIKVRLNEVYYVKCYYFKCRLLWHRSHESHPPSLNRLPNRKMTHVNKQIRLSIGSMNVQGSLNQKCSTSDLINIITKHDIMCLQESWLTPADKAEFRGYHWFRSDRKKQKRKKQNPRGGIITFFKSDIQQGLTKFQSKNQDCMWVKLDRQFFGLDQDVYLCNAYIVPRNSPYFKQGDTDALSILKEEIITYSAKGKIMIIGDLNSRIAENQEYLINNLIEQDRFTYSEEKLAELNYRRNKDQIGNKRK